MKRDRTRADSRNSTFCHAGQRLDDIRGKRVVTDAGANSRLEKNIHNGHSAAHPLSLEVSTPVRTRGDNE